MEINETKESLQPESSRELILTETAQYYLHQTSKWTKFLAIMGFIGAAFMALLGLVLSAGMSAISAFSSAFPAPFGLLMGFFYIVIAVFYFIASLYLYNFGEKVKSGVLFKDALQIEEGFGKLKSLFKMVGITTIVFLVLYALIFIGTIIFTISSASLGHQ
jgi:small-conductance mechanosensitive channel